MRLEASQGGDEKQRARAAVCCGEIWDILQQRGPEAVLIVEMALWRSGSFSGHFAETVKWTDDRHRKFESFKPRRECVRGVTSLIPVISNHRPLQQIVLVSCVVRLGLPCLRIRALLICDTHLLKVYGW